MPGDQSAFQLSETQITIGGTEINFSNLVINQYLADVNSFSFNWRQEKGDANLSAYIDFYQNNLAKEVTITIQKKFTFKGNIWTINCTNQDSLGIEYEITGKGIFAQLDEVPECNSFYKRTIQQIFNDTNSAKGASLHLSPKNQNELFYIVQYNQTIFEFYRMMAARTGEWLYYNGTELVLGDPDTEAISLKALEDVHDVNITAKLGKAPPKQAGFDPYKGEELQHQNQKDSSGGLIGAGLKGGETAFGNSQLNTHFAQAVNTALLGDHSRLQQQASAASIVQLTARTNESKLKLGGKIKMLDEKGNSEGEYIITEIHHICNTDTDYQNHFTAVPAEAKVPPYTNPLLFPVCKPQPALVKDNEDKDGLDRIKVHFPWQPSNQTTPWISVLTPHAGKDKGIRFLPETGEEVLIGFVDNNAERPYVMGAFHTDKNKSGYAYEKNNIKVIGTRTSRRIEIDDDQGTIYIADDIDKDKTKGNSIFFNNDDGEIYLVLNSAKDKDNFSGVVMKGEKTLDIGIRKGGEVVLSINFDAVGKKISLQSKGSVEISADQSIKLSSKSISISASQDLTLEGTSSGVAVKGQKIDVEATTALNAKGLTAKLEGSTQAELKAGAMVSVTGAIVKIN